jgi:hypothetical protein
MKIRTFGTLILATAFVIAPGALLAQSWKGWRGSGGWGPGSPYQRMYDPQTVQTINGTVASVDKAMPLRGMSAGIHLMVKTDKGALRVDLGPEWYIQRLDTKIDKGDQVEVKGSMVKIDGKEALIASEVKKGDETLVLRDSAGIPAWAGWRR